MRQPLNNTTARLLEPTVLLVDLGENRVEAHERPSFELNQVLSIGGASLRKDNQWIILVILLYFLNSLGNLLLNQLLAVLRGSVENQAL